MHSRNGALPEWWPVCSGCGAPIERMAWTFDPKFPDRAGFRATCHGMTAAAMVTWAQAMSGDLMIEVPMPDKAA